jgi:formate hydrogenlyase subunit 2
MAEPADNVTVDASNPEIGRRDFLRASGAGAVAVAFIGLGATGAARPPGVPKMAQSSGVITPDPSLCIGCLTCEVSCSQVHREVGMSDVPRIRIFDAPYVKLDPEIERNYPGRGTFRQQVCLMCPEAPCLPVCPTGALHTDPKTGARAINESTCIACGKCNQACPFPTVDEAAATNHTQIGQHNRIIYDAMKNVYAKCDLCSFRPEGPACVERCPVNIRIKQGVVKSDHLCLELKPSDPANFEKLRQAQVV